MYLMLQVLATAQALEKAGQQLFRQHGLTVAQFNVLNLLSDRPDGMRASGLAGALVVDPSNITGLLKRMNRAGLLKELESPHDGRQRIVALSARGRQLWRKAHADYARRLDAFEAGISADDRRVTEQVLAGMVRETAGVR